MNETSALLPSSLTLQLITISIITLQRELIHLQTTQRNHWYNTYDFIVIGAGSAGCVVAERLSENANIDVLLLEAGGPQSVITDMPAMTYSNIQTTEFDWGYYTTPQKYTS